MFTMAACERDCVRMESEERCHGVFGDDIGCAEDMGVRIRWCARWTADVVICGPTSGAYWEWRVEWASVDDEDGVVWRKSLSITTSLISIGIYILSESMYMHTKPYSNPKSRTKLQVHR
jgi:hypothetical protein